MKNDKITLPNDLVSAHKMILEFHQANSDLTNEINRLKYQLTLFRHKEFGNSSEKLKKQVDDVELQVEDIEERVALPEPVEPEDEPEEILAAKDKKPKNLPKRKPLPDHLPREEQRLEPPKVCPSCNGEKFRTLGEDVSEMLEYIPASFKVIRYIRPRCACTACDQIVQAFPASNPIEKGKAGPGLLAHLIVQKYCNHLPFYRQSQMYDREDMELSRSTMASWAGQCRILMTPLIEALRKEVFESREIHADDTTVPVLAPGAGKTKVGRLWVYLRDGRPHGDETPPAVCYFYSPDRKGARPVEHLQGFTGIVHADAYAGYNQVYNENVTEAACWAHTRRKFYEITVGNPQSSTASEVLERMALVYAVEEEIRGLPPDKRKEIRQEKSKELIHGLFTFMKERKEKLAKKSPTILAINYALNNEKALQRFLEDGAIEIDNNAAERAMRSIAIGRKNWLFAGSDRGGDTAAGIYSLIETAKLNGINPWTYLTYVLSNIQDHPVHQIYQLLPWNLTLP